MLKGGEMSIPTTHQAQLAVRIPKELKERVKVFARENGRSLSSQVSRLLQDQMETEEAQTQK